MHQALHQEPNLGGVQVLPPWDGGPGIYYGAALSAPALQSDTTITRTAPPLLQAPTSSRNLGC